MVALVHTRRKLARLFARWAVRVDPDPALTFTTRKVRSITLTATGEPEQFINAFTKMRDGE